MDGLIKVKVTQYSVVATINYNNQYIYFGSNGYGNENHKFLSNYALIYAFIDLTFDRINNGSCFFGEADNRCFIQISSSTPSKLNILTGMMPGESGPNSYVIWLTSSNGYLSSYGYPYFVAGKIGTYASGDGKAVNITGTMKFVHISFF